MRLLLHSPLAFFEQASPNGNYYVSAAGSDSNSGTVGSPWRTIAKVNATALAPGNTINFRGGDVFTGNLLIAPLSQPSLGNEIDVTSYGVGIAEIDGGNSYAIKIQDCGFVNVSNLNLVGAIPVVTGTYPNKVGTTTSTDAVLLVEATTQSTWYSNVSIDSVNCTGGLFGIHFYSSFTNATAAFENWSITHTTSTDAGVVGVWVSGVGADAYPHDRNGICFRNAELTDVIVTDCPGITAFRFYGPDEPIQTGFGIFILNTQNVVVDGCLGSNCGDASSKDSGGGPVGIIFVEVRDGVITSCEGNTIFATSGVDGEAFDFDAGCQDCILEYSYGHDCEGPGMLVYQFGSHSTHFGSVIRYNIFENCATRNNAMYDEGAGIGTPEVYQNTFYLSKISVVTPVDLVSLDTTSVSHFRNNIFSVGGGCQFGNFWGGALTGNTYNVRSGSTFSLVQGGNAYTSLSGMHTGGLEKNLATANVGASGDPEFASPGAGTDCLPADPVDTLANYDLGATSVAHGAGVDLSDYGITPPVTDWHGNAASVGGVFDSGAVRFGST